MPSFQRLSVPLLLTTVVAAQSIVSAPSQAATMDGMDLTPAVLYGSSVAPRSHVQILLATSDIAAPAGVIEGLSFQPVTSQVASPGFSAHLRIELSVAAATFDAAQPTFAANPGPSPVVVFDGVFTMPNVPATGAVPPSPLPPIVFTTPFAYDPSLGQTLVVDVSCSNLNSTSSYLLGMVGIGGGSLSFLYASGSCQTSSGGYQGTISYIGGQPYPGSAFGLGYHGYPNNRASFNASMMMFDFTLNGMLGATPLPVPLVNLGLPANAPCKLALVPEIMVPIAYLPGTGSGGSGGTGGSLSFQMSIPAVPTLTGLQFGTQAISVDYDNSMPAPVLFPSSAQRWTIGTGARPQAAMVVRMADTVPPNPTGGVQVNQAPVVHLHFQ